MRSAYKAPGGTARPGVYVTGRLIGGTSRRAHKGNARKSYAEGGRMLQQQHELWKNDGIHWKPWPGPQRWKYAFYIILLEGSNIILTTTIIITILQLLLLRLRNSYGS